MASSQTAARKAWNEAMRVTAGSAALLLPAGAQQRPLKRRSDRHKKQERRAKARKVVLSGENEEYKTAVWIDALEGVDPAVTVDEDEEEYDELDELDSGKKKSKRRGGGKSGKSKTSGALPKRFLPRTLASILVEEHGREDSVAVAFLNAEAQIPKSMQLPKRKFCPVTGEVGIYTEPKSGIPYSSWKALEQIRERSPPWMSVGGAAAFLEAKKSILEEEG